MKSYQRSKVCFRSSDSFAPISNARLELHGEFSSRELNFHVEDIEDPFKDTFSWIFDLPFFVTWLQEGSGLFWIHGKPGSGKSTLMKLVFQDLRTRQLLHNWQRSSIEVVAGFFFHHRGSAIQKSFEGLLRSLVVQCLGAVQDPYMKRYGGVWRSYQSITKELAYQQGLKNSAQQPRALREELQRIEEELSNRGRGHTTGTPFSSQPETIFLKDVATSYRDGKYSDRSIPRLDRILRQLVDQTTIEMDLVLFLDALDEFDGHLDMLIEFIHSLLQRSAASKTRVKVCMSSRPWEVLKAHFGSYPGFAMQDYTFLDIENYVSQSLSALPNTAIQRLVPAILHRANGVFLWVRLAIAALLEASTQFKSPESLEITLRSLPDDLFGFYETIVKRIPQQYRRHTFALLELLIRHKGPPAEAWQIRDAVRVSRCDTFGNAAEILLSDTLPLTSSSWSVSGFSSVSGSRAGRDATAIQDIQNWSGGLVDVQSHNGILRPQLMHQTVLDFAMGLQFKGIMIGDLANVLHENGHSFHAKYLITERSVIPLPSRVLPAPETVEATSPWNQDLDPLGANNRKHPGRPWVPTTAADNRVLVYHKEERYDLEIFAFHVAASELTTGTSQYEFLASVPWQRLGLFPTTYYGNAEVCLVSFAAAFNLRLCLRDWKERESSSLLQITQFRDDNQWPLLSSLVFFPVSGAFTEGRLSTARLIFETGFRITQDPLFFPRLVAELWVAKSSTDDEVDRKTRTIPTAALLALAKLALDHGQDPDIDIDVPLEGSQKITCSPLHLATPQLAAELIQHGANTRCVDSLQRPVIQWILEPPSELAQEDRLSCADRYEICTMLVKAPGGAVSAGTRLQGVEAALAEFEKEGYDISELAEALRAHTTRVEKGEGSGGTRVLRWFERLRRSPER